MAGSAGSADSAGSAGSAGSSGSGPLSGTPKALWDYVGIIGTGQSLSVGMQANPPTAKAMMQPYNNLKLSLGNYAITSLTDPATYNPNDENLSLVPLVELIRPTATTYPSAYPANIYGETPHTAMAAEMTALAKGGGLSDFVTVHTVVGENGQLMSVINKTATPVTMGNQTQGHAYKATLFEVNAIQRLAGDKSYGIGAIFLTHGESDAGNPNYENDMLQLLSDYNTDLKAITGQTQDFPLFTNQEHGVYMYAPGDMPRNVDGSTLLQWKAGLDHPDQIICVGPKYQYPYAVDYLHLVALGYELMGEKYAEAFYSQVVLGNHWKPLQPLANTVTRNGKVITVDFEVPYPPLAWDDALPKPHQQDLTEWAQGRGFEVRMGNTRLAIDSVEILDDDTVQITCTDDVPAGATLGYAETAGGDAVPNTSPRIGNLKDSDPFVGDFTGMAQPNYAVTFELPIP